MPRENKQRGRRAEAQKRKNDADDDQDSSSKRRRRLSDADDEYEQIEAPFVAAEEEDQMYGQDMPEDAVDDRPFYGLLDDEEQEYFRRADDMLEVNQFNEAEERHLLLQNLFKEADGKELKMACSQSCSRLMERLIKSASQDQLKTLFQKFENHLLHLVQHRFASHCCETLFIQAAPAVSEEVAESKYSDEDGESSGPSMESLFLASIKELEGNLGFLATNKYGSHALRVLLVILSGEPLDSTNYKSLLQSRQKENIEIKGRDLEKTKDVTLSKRAVPDSFVAALSKLITGSVDGLDTHFLRTLSTHKIGNPTLQLLLQLELTSLGKQRAKDPDSIVRRLLPDEPLVDGTPSAAFANSLMYDPVGSRLLECILSNLPGKMFKTMWQNLWADKIAQLSRNEIASYVVGRVLERLSPEDLNSALHALIPQIPDLISRSRYSLIKTLVERCSLRGVDTTPLSDKLRSCVSDDDGTSLSLPKLLELPPDMLSSTDTNTDGSATAAAPAHPLTAPASATSSTIAAQRHASLLAQSFANAAPPLCTLLFDSITSLQASTCQIIAKSPIHSHVLQAALRSDHAAIVFRRKLITRFYGRVAELALDPSASHFVDAIWDGGTMGMAFVRERLAEELAENERALRDSPYGRKVWRNWRMDMYVTKRDKWVNQMRAEVGNDGFQSFPGGIESAEMKEYGPIRGKRQTAATNGDSAAQASAGASAKKTPLQLARERYAANQAKSSAGPSSASPRGQRWKTRKDNNGQKEPIEAEDPDPGAE